MIEGRRQPVPDMSVSVIVPTRDGARFIAETIQSIAAQTVKPLEIVLVDDGSTDGTAGIALGVSPLVKVVAARGLGPAGARNAGILAASGNLLAFLDHDDLWVPGKLGMQTELLSVEPNIDICLGKLRSFRDGPFRSERDWLGAAVPGYLTITMMVRRDCFARAGLLDATRPFSDSAEWLLRAEDAGLRVKMIDEVLTLHRVHDRNYSRVNGDMSRAEFLQLARQRIERARSTSVDDGQPVSCE